MSQSARDFRRALFAAAQALYADIRDTTDAPPLVSLGVPGTYQPNILIAVGMSTGEAVTRPTMGTNRSRERAVDVTVTISVYQASSENDQATAMDTCDDLIDMLEAYIRTSPNERFGGACRDSLVSSIDGPNPDVITHPQSGAVTGRVAEAVVTVSAFVRY